MNTVLQASERALNAIRKGGGVIRTKEALAKGIQSRTLGQLLDAGKLELISRGIYRLTEGEPVSSPDLFTVATRVPKAVICLISALAFHDLTTQIPHKIDIALERTASDPRLGYPPLAIHRFSGQALLEGIEKHKIDGVEIKVYNAEKTLADCFKFRNQVGLDVVLEALKFYRKRKKLNMKAVMHYAKICRVENVMKPYLEAVV
jgi:predicted transcriptional regulator of viral defense system